MNLEQLLGDEADALLNHRATAFPSEHLTLPGPDVFDEIFRDSDRSPTVLRNLGTLYNTVSPPFTRLTTMPFTGVLSFAAFSSLSQILCRSAFS